MAAGKLYTYPNNIRAFKGLIAAEYANEKVTVLCKEPDFQLGLTNATPEFLAKFPFGKVPAFESSTGLCISDANAIAFYFGTKAKLNGNNDDEAALIQQWIHFAEHEITSHASTWVYPTLGYVRYNKDATQRAKDAIVKVLTYLNTTLATRTFLVAERISSADIAVVCELLWLYQRVLDPKFRAPFTHVNRWFVTCVNQPQFKSVLGEVVLAETMAEFDSKAFAANFPSENKKKPEGAKADAKKAEPKKAEVKKTEPKKKEPEEVEVDESEAIIAAEQKEMDPAKLFLSTLPKPVLDFDTWKKYYSNNECKDSMTFLFENLDLENYSFWRGDYTEDLQGFTRTFMTMNLVSGMMQRLDPIRKAAFGNVCVFGSDGNNTITGVWMWRGKDLIFDVTECNVDSQSYSWKKLDPTAAADKRLIEQFFTWGETIPLDDFPSKPAEWKTFK